MTGLRLVRPVPGEVAEQDAARMQERCGNVVVGRRPGLMGRGEQAVVDWKRSGVMARLLDPPHQLVPARDLLWGEQAGPRPQQAAEQLQPWVRAQGVAPVAGGKGPRDLEEDDVESVADDLRA